MIRTKRALLAALGAALSAASLAGTTHAAPKPGFLPGTWIGTGTISGRSANAIGTTTFSGKLSFRLKVARDGRVSGTGTWSRTMIGAGRIDAKIAAKTAVRVVGSPTDVRLTGTYRAVGTFSSDDVTRTSTFAPATLNERLRIVRAGTCRVTGKSTFQGVTTTWSAQLAGSGTCLT